MGEGMLNIRKIVARYHEYRNKPIILICGAARSGTTALFYFFLQSPRVIAFNESRILIAIYQLLAKVRFIDGLSKRMDALQAEMRRLYYNYRVAIRHNNLMNKTIVEKEGFDIITLPEYDYGSCVTELLSTFPNMKVIYMIRSPDKTINSMLKRKWGYSVNKELGFMPRDYTLDECIKIWNAAALAGKLIEQKKEFASRVYLLKFEDLIQYPVPCSLSIHTFTGIWDCPCFEPKPTQEMDLDEATLAEIWNKTEEHRAYYNY